MKRFLFITNNINPFETTFGGAQRSHLLLKAILKLGRVDVIAFAEGIESNIEGCSVLYSKQIISSIHMNRFEKWIALKSPRNPYSIFPINKSKEDIVDTFVQQNNYDAIVVRYVNEAMSCGLMKYADKLILDVDDHPKDALKNKARQIKSKPNKLYHYIASQLSKITVKYLANNLKAALFSNPNQVVGRQGYYLPNISFDEPLCEYVDFTKTNQRLFFVGRLDYAPNYLGLDYFIDKVWLQIKNVVQDAELHIAGKIDEQFADTLAPYVKKWNTTPGVCFLGFVDDINTEYHLCKATISPILFGAGTNIKLIESMQRKRVCVTTKCGVRGLNKILTPNENVLVALNAKEYARMCIKVLTDESFNRKIAANAYEIMQKEFTHDAFCQIIKQIVTTN